MPRIRTIKPAFTQDEDLSILSAEAHLFAAGLLCYADDEGYFKANPVLLKAAIFPTRETSGTIPEILQSLSGAGFIKIGKGIDGKDYGVIVKFLEHQKVSHPTDSKMKLIVKFPESLQKFPESIAKLPEPLRPELKGIEGNGIEGNRAHDGSLAFETSMALYPKDKRDYSQLSQSQYFNGIGEIRKTHNCTSTEAVERLDKNIKAYVAAKGEFCQAFLKYLDSKPWKSDSAPIQKYVPAESDEEYSLRIQRENHERRQAKAVAK